MSKIEYTNKLIAFDIETTTFNYSNENYVDTYLSNFLECEFNPTISKENFLKTVDNPYWCRSWNDINHYLIILNNRAKLQNKTQIIYVHNLAYEFDGIIKNCDFIRSNYSNENTLFIKSRKVCFTRVQNIELRCSYILLNKSLFSLGQLYGLNKLDLDYSKRYFSFSQLPDDEFEYNLRDTQVTLYSILKECSKYKYIKNVEDIPLTYTSFTRKLNKSINDKKTTRIFVNRNAVQKKYNVEFIKYLEQIYTGGYTHASSFFAFKVLQNVSSIDITSSYPDAMIHRLYPYNFTKSLKGLKWFNFMLKQNNVDFNYIINHYSKPFEYAFIATGTLKNVKVKKFNNTDFPVISASKCLNEQYSTILDNGRIVKSNLIEIALSHVDFWLIQQFYNFEIVNVKDLYYTKQFRPLADFTLNCVKTYADEKTVLKNCNKKVETSFLTQEDFYCERTKKYIFNDEEIQNILKIEKLEDLQQEINVLLSSAKSKLNGQYGINVQKLYQENYLYDLENDMFDKVHDTKLPRDLFRNFFEGLYITAYARLNLFTMALFLVNNSKCDLVYSDTDSWKVLGDPNEVKTLVNKYNSILEQNVQNSKDYCIGYFDFEETYDNFITGGCKKYITSNDKKINATIAGVPKRNISIALTDLFKQFNFDFRELVNIAFKPNTVYDFSAIEKLSSKYTQQFFKGWVEDENGEKGFISFNSMVELTPTNYVLCDLKTKSNYNYIKYIEFVQNRKIKFKNTKIFKKNNKVDFDFIIDYDSVFLKNEVNSDEFI